MQHTSPANVPRTDPRPALDQTELLLSQCRHRGEPCYSAPQSRTAERHTKIPSWLYLRNSGSSRSWSSYGSCLLFLSFVFFVKLLDICWAKVHGARLIQEILYILGFRRWALWGNMEGLLLHF